MKKKLLTILATLFCFTSLISLSSCEEDDPYYTYLPGTWASVYDERGPIYYNDVIRYDKYIFYDDGYGKVEFYERGTNRFVYTEFRWRSYGGDWLEIDYQGGGSDKFYYRFNQMYLELSQDSYFSHYRGYQLVPY